MKKTRKNLKSAQNKSDEKFAKKVICQMIASVLIFAVVFANSKLSNSFSVKLNNGIRHYLCVSADFDKVVDNAKAYFDNFINSRQSVPVNSGDVFDTKEDK